MFKIKTGKLSIVGKHAIDILQYVPMGAWEERLGQYEAEHKTCGDPDCECSTAVDYHPVVITIKKVLADVELDDTEVIMLGYLELNSAVEQMKPKVKLFDTLVKSGQVEIMNAKEVKRGSVEDMLGGSDGKDTFWN